MSFLNTGLARRGRLAAGLLLVVALLAACGPGNSVNIQYKGFAIQASRTSAKAGEIVFNLSNQEGQVLHQFLIVQTDVTADKLPLGADAKVDETGLKIVGRVD